MHFIKNIQPAVCVLFLSLTCMLTHIRLMGRCEVHFITCHHFVIILIASTLYFTRYQDVVYSETLTLMGLIGTDRGRVLVNQGDPLVISRQGH